MKDFFRNITKSENYRLYFMHVVIIILFCALIVKLFSLQITKGDYYSREVMGTAIRSVEIEAPRGAIYDRYGRPLAVNNTAYAVCLDPSVGVDNLNSVLFDLIGLLEKNNEKMTVSLPITSALPHEFLFSGSINQEKRWKEDMNLDEGLNAEQCFSALRDKFEIDPRLDDIEAGKIMALRCELYKKRFSQYIPIPIAYNISEKTLTALQENGSSYPCAYVDDRSQREYPYGKYFSHMLGYIGTISEDELKGHESEYSLNDQIGKDGIEQAFEGYLKGSDGSRYIEIDSSGRRISTIENEGTAPVNGNNIYLTVDGDIQQTAYNALEDALTAAQLDRLSGGKFGYSYSDVFASMIESNTVRIRNIMNSKDGTVQGNIKKYILSVNSSCAQDTSLASQTLLKGYKSGAISSSQIMLALYEQGQITDSDGVITALKKGTMSAGTALVSKMRSREITPQMTAMDPCTGSVVVNDIHNGGIIAAVSYPSYDNNELVNSFNNEYYLQLQSDPTTPMVNRPFTEPRAPGSTFKMITALAGLQEGIITPSSTIYDKGTFTDAGRPFARCWIGGGNGSHGAVNVSSALEVSCNYFFYTLGYKMGIGTLNKYMEAVGLNSPTGVEIYELYNSKTMLDYPSRMSSPEYKAYVTKQRYDDPTPGEIKWSAGDTIRTAIGQSYNNYTSATLAKYVATIANGGTRYKNHFLDRVSDTFGSTVLVYKTVEEEKIPIKKENLDAIFKGMNLVTKGGSGTLSRSFAEYDINIGAKSGTAQESDKRSEHTVFVAFAPYESPQISIAVMIPYGDNANTAPAPTVAKAVISRYMQTQTTIENRSYDTILK